MSIHPPWNSSFTRLSLVLLFLLSISLHSLVLFNTVMAGWSQNDGVIHLFPANLERALNISLWRETPLACSFPR